MAKELEIGPQRDEKGKAIFPPEPTAEEAARKAEQEAAAQKEYMKDRFGDRD